MKSFTRREFIKTSSLGFTLSALAPLASFDALAAAIAEAPDEKHFFLLIVLPNGADSMYLFDSRPLALTAAGLVQNYLGQEPYLLSSSSSNFGTTTWASALTRPLLEFQKYFSIINGVHMSNFFDGHEENMNLFMTGNPFGAHFFVPELGTENNKGDLDFVQAGNFILTADNLSSSLSLQASTWQVLLERMKTAPAFQANNDPVLQFIRKRAEKMTQTPGLFAEGVKKMLSSFQGAEGASQRFSQFQLNIGPDEFENNLQIMRETFKTGFSRNFVMSFDEMFDVHAASEAQQQPQKFGRIVDRLLRIFRFLDNQSIDGKNSLLDQTTFLLGSEFGRTRKQILYPVHETGTDHNPVNNSILIGGKGIQGGLVVGGTDLQTVDESPSELHKTRDKDLLATMGRPFDFQTLRPYNDWPKTYRDTDFLQVGSVMNTLFEAFGLPTQIYRKLADQKTLAPVLKPLLKRT